MVNREFVIRKIDLIQEELEKLRELSGFSLEEVASDFYKQSTLERLLEKIIMRGIDINNHVISALKSADADSLENFTLPKNFTFPKNYRETFTAMADLGVFPKDFANSICRSIGLRNMLAHDYDRIDCEKLYLNIGDCLRDYVLYCDYVLKYLVRI